MRVDSEWPAAAAVVELLAETGAGCRPSPSPGAARPRRAASRLGAVDSEPRACHGGSPRSTGTPSVSMATNNAVNRHWAPQAAGKGDPRSPRRRRRRATYKRPHGVRHVLAGYDLSRDKLYGHITSPRAHRVPGLLPLPALAAPAAGADRDRARHLQRATEHQDRHPRRGLGRGQQRRARPVPFYGSWLNRIEAQFTALRYFALDRTDHATHAEQALTIRRYIAWRNRHAGTHPRLREVVTKAEIIKRAKVS